MVKILSMRYVGGPQDFGMSLTEMYIYRKKTTNKIKAQKAA